MCVISKAASRVTAPRAAFRGLTHEIKRYRAASDRDREKLSGSSLVGRDSAPQHFPAAPELPLSRFSDFARKTKIEFFFL